MPQNLTPDAPEPSRQVLAQAPGRVLTFLTGAGRSRAIRATLRRKGYTAEEHKEGWDLLHAASGFREAEPVEDDDADVADAIAELDAWDEPSFRWMRATLSRRYPVQCHFLFNNLSPSTGAGSIVSVKTLLDRADELEKSPDRKATRKEDQAAIKLLASRGFTADERAHLRELIDVASQPVDDDESDSEPDQDASVVESKEHVEALRALHAWWLEWSEIARAVIKKRIYLIQLGLAKRAAKKKTPQEK